MTENISYLIQFNKKKSMNFVIIMYFEFCEWNKIHFDTWNMDLLYYQLRIIEVI